MILVIGGGPAGRLAAMRMARAGAEVTVAERRAMGGQCLQYGCMVVCALSDVARDHPGPAEPSTISEGPNRLLRVSYPKLMEEMGEIEGTITRVLDEETEEAGVACISR